MSELHLKTYPIVTAFLAGCSSGFGFALAVRLDQMGFTVIGACRTLDDHRAVTLKQQCSDRLKLIKLDIGRDDEMRFAALQVDSILRGRPLWAVVNNAGIGLLHGCEWGSSGCDLFKRALDINTLGAIRVSRAMLPFLKRATDSRLVIVTSIDTASEPMTQPAYAMSKIAARSFANSLRRELKPQRVHVAVVEPGFYATGATEEARLMSDLENNWRQTPAPTRDALGGDITYQRYIEFTRASLLVRHDDVTPVTDALVQAVAGRGEPKYITRVVGGLDSIVLWLVDLLPMEVIDQLQRYELMITFFKLMKFFTNGPLYL